MRGQEYRLTIIQCPPCLVFIRRGFDTATYSYGAGLGVSLGGIIPQPVGPWLAFRPVGSPAVTDFTGPASLSGGPSQSGTNNIGRYVFNFTGGAVTIPPNWLGIPRSGQLRLAG